MNDLQRQVRFAFIVMLIVLPIGILGFMQLEGLEFLEAAWLTIITLTTIGYGDVPINEPASRVFTIFLILVGLGALTFLLSSSFALVFNPERARKRQETRIQKAIDNLNYHYVICGMGELVDKTIGYLLQSTALHQAQRQEQLYKPIDNLLDRIFGDDEDGHFLTMRAILHRIIFFFIRRLRQEETILDILVVITEDETYADHLRASGLLVIPGDSTDNVILTKAGIQRAQAMMVMLDSDTESLLTVLTANNLNPALYVSAAALEERLMEKMIRVGANSVLAPFDIAGQFLNNATLRPAVSDYFNGILFDQASHYRITRLHLWDDSSWIGQRLGTLKLREQFEAGVIGIRLNDGSFMAAPSDDYILQEEEVLLAVAPAENISALQLACHENAVEKVQLPLWQRLPVREVPPTSETTYGLVEVEELIDQMSDHYIICGSTRVARNAITKLDPTRPFVIISDDNGLTRELIQRGFKVVHGNPTQEDILLKAGTDRAQAIMVAVEKKADSVLTVLTCRSLSKRLLITATANSDDMVDKLRRAGADRVASPFHVAAQFVLLSTTRPEISDFFQYVLYNYQTGLETADLHMLEGSPWIGETIEDLRLDRLFRAGVIGVRLADGETFIYAPSGDHEIQAGEVLIVVTPMVHFDEMRATAHGSATKRPKTLRQIKVRQSNVWSRDMIRDLIDQHS